MGSNLTASSLRKQLTTATKEQLIEEVIELFTKFDVVQKHFALKLKSDTQTEILADYKARLSKAMLPKSDWSEPKVSEARRIINEFQKVARSPSAVADLMLFYVECGIKFLNDLGDYKASFYDSLERMFEAALKLARKNGMEAEFKDRCEEIVAKSSDMGYGLGDALQILLDEYF